MKSRTRMTGAAALAIAAVVLAACSSNTSSEPSAAESSSAPAAPSGSASEAPASPADTCPGLAEAAAYLAEVTVNPSSPGYDLPLTMPIPAKQKVIAVETPVPIAKATNDERENALALIDWSMSRIVVDGTPEGPANAMTQALSENPNALFYAGYDPATMAAPLKEALDRNIPVVAESVPNNTNPAIVATVRDHESNDLIAKMTAAYIVTDSNCAANVEAWTVPSQPILTTYQASLEKWLAEWCPECKVNLNNYEFADIGVEVPGMVVSALQRNPEAGYVIFGYGESIVGLHDALKTAGLDETVKVGGAIPGPDQYEGLRTGSDAFWATDSGPGLAWKETDLMIRALTGDDLAGAQAAPIPAQLLTPENIGGAVFDEAGYWLGYDGYEAAYKKMWGIS